ncbi:LLM class flavin-dependent oxidoreductase [Chitinophaga nivalis]|uniref:LLM class flavin-dependent oxidoreductase n=1 Tax=Chitinophaga nivalis TaxID=2991709 RepID=A0ABT3IPA9_9BACT|nr:LLM class flavin-dependent oxidoreductase [Chitinophaga nivalis]MCW3464750.1 LLM class flavin-dependent oxidoreductase [Chitinophaga nivalis]MCW3485559.1 LLM class flavin-dependent oxidoreductase [Chitinophaga nivalis]
MDAIKLGVLDFGEGYDSLHDLITYATDADQLGYSRFWLGEHYIFNSLWCNPEPILPLLLAYTERIRIGTAGILLSAHTPYRIAITFKQLSNMFSNRVDLGFAAGLPAGDNIRQLLHADAGAFDEKLRQVLELLREEDNMIGNGIPVPPYRGEIPELWSLGCSCKRLDSVLESGLNFSRSLFHEISDDAAQKEQLRVFMERYADRHGAYPKINLAVSGICSDSEAMAKQLYKQSPYYQSAFIRCNLLGSPSYFQDTICEYAAAFGINEFIFLNLAAGIRDRLHSLRLLAPVFQLPAAHMTVQ